MQWIKALQICIYERSADCLKAVPLPHRSVWTPPDQVHLPRVRKPFRSEMLPDRRISSLFGSSASIFINFVCIYHYFFSNIILIFIFPKHLYYRTFYPNRQQSVHNSRICTLIFQQNYHRTRTVTCYVSVNVA